MSLEFGLHPNVYATGGHKGLRQMLERIWIHDHSPGEGKVFLISGFANFNGGARFYKTFSEHVEAGGEIFAFFGGSTSQRLTSKQVVEALLECGARVVIINRKRILHAKLYGVESSTSEQSLVISSGNFTGPGLAQNIEASLLMDDSTLTEMGFSWNDLVGSIEQQNWLFYEVNPTDGKDPAWQLLYDESPGKVELDESDEVTLIIRLGHADTARVLADKGTNAGKGSQYFWLSKDCFDFFPALTIRNNRGLKGTLSTMISLEYMDLDLKRDERVTFEAENNLDFRLGTGALRYTKLCKEGDLACITRLSETQFQLRIVSSDDVRFSALNKIAVSFVGHQGKRYGFVANEDFCGLIGASSL